MKSQIESRAEQQKTRGNQQGFVDKQKVMAKQQKPMSYKRQEAWIQMH